MTRHLHIDAFSGVSGDMFLGALVDTGVPLQTLEKGLKALDIKGYRLREQQVIRNSLRATKVEVAIQKGFTKPLSLAAIKKTLTNSRLPDEIRTQALRTFQLIAEAEGAVHGKSPGKVHFHEVGVIDSLVDIVGTLLGIAHLNVTTVSFSPINLGAGTIATAHGLLPVPAPAVAQMAQGIPVFSNGPTLELTTPTGMALIQEESVSPITSERIIQLETNIDDMNPQLYDQMMNHIFDAGALDVTLTPTMMKRNRPGTIVSVVAWPKDLQVLTTILLSETTTLGVRVQDLERAIVPRQVQTVRLPNGSVRVKIAELGNGQVRITPEYRDCAALAERTKQPIQAIIDLARQTFTQKNNSKTASRSKKPTKISR
jgi:uncharacterized protein (DUF111 family)